MTSVQPDQDRTTEETLVKHGSRISGNENLGTSTALISGRGSQMRRVLVQAMGIGVFYSVVLVYFSVKIPDFFTTDNLSGVLSTSAALGLVTIGQAYAIVSGGFDLSVGGVVPLAAVVFGKVSEGHSVGVAVLAAVLSGMAVGLGNGIIIAKFKINPLITTLATLSIVGGIAYVVTDGLTVILSNPSASFLGDIAFGQVQWGVILFVGVAITATIVMRYTTYGRAIYAVGGNREAAELAGIRVDAVSGSVYLISGACAALAGVVLASQLLAAAPNLGTDTPLNSVTAVILGGAALTGGVGGVPGSVLGVLLLGTVANGLALQQVSSFYQTIATGVILLLAVSFARLREVLLAGKFVGPRRKSNRT